MVALCDENEVKEMMWPHREEDLSNGLVPDAWSQHGRIRNACLGPRLEAHLYITLARGRRCTVQLRVMRDVVYSMAIGSSSTASRESLFCEDNTRKYRVTSEGSKPGQRLFEAPKPSGQVDRNGDAAVADGGRDISTKEDRLFAELRCAAVSVQNKSNSRAWTRLDDSAHRAEPAVISCRATEAEAVK